MQRHFKLVSISHKTAPLQLREQLALNEHQVKSLMNKYKEIFNISEILVLSTCNRTEIYYCSEKNLGPALIKILILEQGLAAKYFSDKNFIYLSNHDEAVRYIFRIAMGLESQVIGDIQISNQIKKAYQWSADLGYSGPFMHRLLHTIFFTNKRVIQETSFRDGTASVSYATYKLIEELAATIQNPKIAVIGLGKIGTDLVKNLAESDIKNVTISNRTREKAIELAEANGFENAPLESYYQVIDHADIIVSAISQPTPFFTKERLSNISAASYKYFIDLAVPRSIDKSIEEINHVLVYNIDNIHMRTASVIEKRKKATPQVERIIQESVAEFDQWTKEMLFSPTIQKLKNTLEEIRRQEIAKYMKKLDQNELREVEKITKNITQKIINLPVIQLKAACQRGEAETLLDVLNNLFDLEKTTVS